MRYVPVLQYSFGLAGLIFLPFLLPLTESPALAQQTVRIQTPAPYNACNLRSGPGVNYTSVGTFWDGSVVTLTGEQVNGWYSAQVGNTLGWMAKQCLGL